MKLINFLLDLKDDDKTSIFEKTNILIKIANIYGIQEVLKQIETEESLTRIVKDYLDEGESMDKVDLFLSGMGILNKKCNYWEDYHNAENLTPSQFYYILYQLLVEIKNKGLDNEEI